jgi:hypothetical protein
MREGWAMSEPAANLESLFGPSRVTVTKLRFGYEIQISDNGMEWLNPHWRPTRAWAIRHARKTAQRIRTQRQANPILEVEA